MKNKFRDVSMINTVILLFIGLIIGILITYFFMQKRISSIERKIKQTDVLQNEKIIAETKLLQNVQYIEEIKLEKVKLEDTISLLRQQVEKQKEEGARLETKVQETEKNIQEQKELLKQATESLRDTFNALSSDALKSNNETFLKLAKQNLETILEKTKSEFGKQAIEETLEPLKISLERYNREIKTIENLRKEDLGSLKEQITQLANSSENLKKETAGLKNALKRPEVRGKWGELQLRRVVELVGMSEYCDFSEQVSVQTEEGQLRPDLIVYLPGHRNIVVDSKAPTKYFMEACEAETEEKREAAKIAYSRAVRHHMNELSKKNYWKQFEDAPDFVVLFLPGESFFSAALELDNKLIEDGIQNKVIIATPTTFIALLRTVAMSWQQQKLTENAKQIAETGTELYERICTFQEHLDRVGSSLDASVKQYNKAVGSFTSRIVPGARKLEELGVQQTKKKLQETQKIDTNPRALSSE